MTTLPRPATNARIHSEKLTDRIREEIKMNGGQIDFARFMELALYAPDLGYYSSGTHKFGKQGDFVTAPEISPLFARCIAKQFQQIFMTLPEKNILEFGAGSGIFAKDLLLQLKKGDQLPDHYYILEVSAELRDRQIQRFNKECPELLSRITWLDSLPKTPFVGIIFANEVLDAMPAHRFEWSQQSLKECGVAFEKDKFIWQHMPPSVALTHQLETIMQECQLPDLYRSEIHFFQSAWIQSLADILQQGAIVLIDYGYGRREYYHPERIDGTLMCFYQHHYHNNPFIHVGRQDITSHVDFTSIAESAEEAGLSLAGFTTQAAFLLALGLLDHSSHQNYQNNQAIKTLTLPGQMGEIVKVMALTKQITHPLLGFDLQDRRRDL